MEKIDQIRELFVSFRDNGIKEALRSTYEEAKPQAEDKNIEQLQRGERADGTSLEDYSPVSVAYYGKPAGPMLLYDQGNFYKGITLFVTHDGIEYVGLDGKTPMLQQQHGQLIIGIQEEEQDELNQDAIIPILQDRTINYFTR